MLSIDYKIILSKYFDWQVVKMHDKDLNLKLTIIQKFIESKEKNQSQIDFDFWRECGHAD